MASVSDAGRRTVSVSVAVLLPGFGSFDRFDGATVTVLTRLVVAVLRVWATTV